MQKRKTIYAFLSTIFFNLFFENPCLATKKENKDELETINVNKREEVRKPLQSPCGDFLYYYKGAYLVIAGSNHRKFYTKYFTNGWWSFLTERYTLSAAHYYTWVAIEKILKQLNFIFSTRKYTILSTNLEFYLGSVIGIGWYPAKIKFKYWQIGFLEISLNIMKVIMWLCRGVNLFFFQYRKIAISYIIEEHDACYCYKNYCPKNNMERNYPQRIEELKNLIENKDIDPRKQLVPFLLENPEYVDKFYQNNEVKSTNPEEKSTQKVPQYAYNKNQEKIFTKAQKIYLKNTFPEQCNTNPFTFFIAFKLLFQTTTGKSFFYKIYKILGFFAYTFLCTLSEVSFFNVKFLDGVIKLKFFTCDKFIVLLKQRECKIISNMFRISKNIYSLYKDVSYYEDELVQKNCNDIFDNGVLYEYRNKSCFFFQERDGILLKLLEFFLTPYVSVDLKKIFKSE